MISKKGSHHVFYSNAAWQYGLQVAKYIFPLLVLPYLTRVLEPEGYAIYAYVVSFMTIARVFVEFGFNLLGTRMVANSKRVSDINEITGAITQARLLLSVIGIPIILAMSLSIPITQANLLYTMLAYVGVCCTALAPDFVFQGYEKMRPLTSRYVLSKGVATVLTFALVRSVDDIMWVPILDILAGMAALVWSFYAAWRMFGVKYSVAPLKRTLRVLRTAGLYCASNVASAFLTGFTTLFVGFAIEDTTLISFWSVGVTAISAMTSFYTPITNSLYPRMIRTNDYIFAKKLSVVALPVLLAGTVLIALSADVVMLVLGGYAYVDGSGVLVRTSPVAFFSFYSMLFGWPILGAKGKIVELTRTTVVSAMFSVVALMVIYFLGIASLESVCVVRVATEVVLCTTRLIECYRAKRSED